MQGCETVGEANRCQAVIVVPRRMRRCDLRSSVRVPVICQIALDCGVERSVTGSREHGRDSVVELTITSGLRELSRRLADGAAIAKGAVACAEAGSEREALRIAMDLDELFHEAATLHSAIRLVGRMKPGDEG